MKGVPFGRGMGLLGELRERPELLLRELAWRWLAGGLLLALAGFEGWRIWVAAQPALRATGFARLTQDALEQDPMQALTAFSAAVDVLKPMAERAFGGLLPLGVFCWVAAFALGRAAVLRRYDRRLHASAWLLAGCEALRLGVITAVSLAWTVLLHLAGSVALRPAAPNSALYILLCLLFTAAVLAAWVWLGRSVELATVLALLEQVTLGAALRQSLRLGDLRIREGVRGVHRAASSARWLLVILALVLSLFPSPWTRGWAQVAWWALLSLLLMAAAGAVRLAVQFALLGVVREARAPAVVRVTAAAER